MFSTLHRVEAIAEMNRFGNEDTPFFFVIDYQMHKNIILPLHSMQQSGILYSVNGRTNANHPPAALPEKFTCFPSPMPYETYRKKYEVAAAAIQHGDTYLINLTAETPITISCTLEHIFYLSNAPYKLLLPGHCVVFSPETFITINNGVIRTCPMKGTIDADIPDAHRLILEDEKEKAEQYTIVDLLRNDLNMVASDVRVERFRYIEEIESRGKRLLQVSSEISGVLPGNYSSIVGDILFTLLPAGSVTGAPKKRTVEIIEAAEQYERGYYTGVFGYYDKGSLACGVMIRYIEQTANGYRFKSGGGITCMSDPGKEYQEMIGKVYVPAT